MIDSDNVDALRDPLFAGCPVATYADLLTQVIVDEFAGRLLVIDRGMGDPMNRAHIADVETGAFTIDSGAARIKQWSQEGRRWVTAYVNRSNWAALAAAVNPVRPRYWVATLDGTLSVGDPEPAAVQFAGETAIGRHVDVSVIYDPSFAVFGGSSNGSAVVQMKGAAAQLLVTAQEITRVAAEL